MTNFVNFLIQSRLRGSRTQRPSPRPTTAWGQQSGGQIRLGAPFVAENVSFDMKQTSLARQAAEHYK